ncbi:MAG: hypothetical protein NZM33_03845 [Bryobacteraceae bacterium]|nr:hypothetical protein [Bryobacteraceae bacterium]
MAEFRKWFLVLAVVALLTSGAVSANAQPFSCAASAVPPLIRAEGLAELVGDIVLQCTGTSPGGTANFRVFFSQTVVTSRLLSSGPPVVTEAVLIRDEAPSGSQVTSAPPYTATTNVYLGQWSSATPWAVDWLGVPLPAPGSPGIYRIRNVRVDATALPASTIPVPLQAFVSISAVTSIPVIPNQVTVAYVTPGLSVSVTRRSYKQCLSPTAQGAASVTFTELFASAFRLAPSILPNPGAPYSVPGGVNFTEHGFAPNPTPSVPLDQTGIATQATQLIVELTGVPGGVSSVSFSTTTTGGLAVTPTSGTITISGGSGSVTFTVTATNTTGTESLTVDLTPTTLPSSGSVLIAGNFAPLSTTATPLATPVPRFRRVYPAVEGMTFGTCRTLLLFPFVTNVAGWDTGIAISNTSSDPIGTPAQAAACRLHYYGTPTVAAQTTPVISNGEQLAFTLSSGGGVVGTTKTCAATGTLQCAAPGFQGYIIAVCDFQFAHAFAFVSDLGASRVAHGYLALVIPDRTPRADGPHGSSNGHGEQLGN